MCHHHLKAVDHSSLGFSGKVGRSSSHPNLACVTILFVFSQMAIKMMLQHLIKDGMS